MCDKNLEAVIEKNLSIKLCLNCTCGTACVSESVLCLLQICDELGVKRPSSVKVFSGKSESTPLPPLIVNGRLPASCTGQPR